MDPSAAKRTIRYQGAILRGDCLLLIKHTEHATGRAYWLLPGGGREPGETEAACVVREMHEETHLDVVVKRLLLEEADVPQGVYKRLKTYLCEAVQGEAKPGYEPEEEASRKYAITDVKWIDLRNSTEWGSQVTGDAITYPRLQRIQAVLGYSVERDMGNGEKTVHIK